MSLFYASFMCPSWHAVGNLMLFLSIADLLKKMYIFFLKNSFKNIIRVDLDCQAVKIPIRPDLLGLICAQAVCKGYQQGMS